ncbi:hypothetical protein Nlim_1349 [Candidatus Nitrosarchaeum limnium SFB1]|jgi:hypothetical protein|uniref:Uncharacterized protein n=1 Tax=Candidatus Nitrosarchaeum limnium SFB1 TaxID=886738 RepID=F3KLG9_9ARCH|nr:hypothetical protein Nlim_1349 [Candidatus Nitrosarchaeum limnium SFB1]
MSEEEKGKRFLELIDEQNSIQWKIISKLISLINSKWNSSELKIEIESLVENHTKITKELNSLDESNPNL